MSLDTFGQPAPASSAPASPAAAAAPLAEPAPISLDDVNELIESVRSMMIQAKNRQRSMEQNSERGRIAVLFTLSKLGPMRVSALAKECLLDLSTVSRHLRTLEDEGHIAKSTDPDDKRAFQVGLTERGHGFMQEFWRNRLVAVHAALSESAWSAHDAHTLAKLLERFVRDTEGCM